MASSLLLFFLLEARCESGLKPVLGMRVKTLLKGGATCVPRERPEKVGGDVQCILKDPPTARPHASPNEPDLYQSLNGASAWTAPLA